MYASEFVSRAKADASPVTDADLRADEVIRDALQSAWPGVLIVSEEGNEGAAPDATHRFFLVDPLDGTKEFLQRNGEFTVNIALVENGAAVAGVVHAPALEETFFGSSMAGAWKRKRSGDVALKVREVGEGECLRVLNSRSHASVDTDAWLQRLGRDHEVTAMGSSLKFCRIAEGAADLYPKFGPTNQWDTAAGQAVLESAGGAVRVADGTALRYGLDRSLLNPSFVALGDRSLRLPPFVSSGQ